MLPAALNLWGIAYSARLFRGERTGAALAVATAFFSLAIFAKVSAGFGVAAMATALALNGRARKGIALATITLATTAVLLLATNAASDGRMLDTMRACATAGATLWNYAHAPLTFAYTLVHQDPMSVVITILLVVGVAALPRSGWREIPTCIAVASLAMVLVLETSPGIDFNHFLDFFGCALIFVGYQIVRGRIPAPLGTGAVSIAAAMQWCCFSTRSGRRNGNRSGIRYRPCVRISPG